MAWLGSGGDAGSRLRRPLIGLFDPHDTSLGLHMAGSGPTSTPLMSEASLEQTSSTLSSPCTSASADLHRYDVTGDNAGETLEDAKVSLAKVAVHHHRTKLQRNVLNEVVTSLQGAYKHCRRQMSADFAMQDQHNHLGLAALLMAEDEAVSSYPSATMISGETKEMRKNRQKAESKMRMRRKEVAQFAALTTYARIAYEHIQPPEAGQPVDSAGELVGRCLTLVFSEHRDDWVTLIALEKRLFHTVRLKLGLHELFVKKLTERLAEMSAYAAA